MGETHRSYRQEFSYHGEYIILYAYYTVIIQVLVLPVIRWQHAGLDSFAEHVSILEVFHGQEVLDQRGKLIFPSVEYVCIQQPQYPIKKRFYQL